MTQTRDIAARAAEALIPLLDSLHEEGKGDYPQAERIANVLADLGGGEGEYFTVYPRMQSATREEENE